MAGYKPIHVSSFETGLVQSREEFLLPNDAYPILENAYVWRERIKRKQGCSLLGRLRRVFSELSIGNSGASPWSFNIFSTVSPSITEPQAEIQIGSVVININGTVLNDQSNGTLATSPPSGVTGIINYSNGNVVITGASSGQATTISFNYYPNLPVMGMRTRELNGINAEQTIAFDTTYAYTFNFGWSEWLPGTTWTGANYQFFWSTNYWVDTSNNKIFWVNNNNDPIRYTNGVGVNGWVNFNPQIEASGTALYNALVMLPFRGRLLAFNTFEGTAINNGLNMRQRIRWSAIGTPFTVVGTVPVNINADAWRDDIRGQGGFLDIPTAQDIIAVGQVRDNIVIYTESATWQLRHTGRSIQPFIIERVNSELGSASTFSAVQFDTSLVGIGDKGIVECDSYKSERIDIKIPDLVFQFNANLDEPQRVHGVREFYKRLAYWTYPYLPNNAAGSTFPNRRLVYNYENDSWAIFTDSFTCLGTYQPIESRAWNSFTNPATDTWANQNTAWIDLPDGIPTIIAGNQQGYALLLDQQVANDNTLTITNITGNTPSPTSINSVNHNLENGQIILINQIPAGTPFANLNGGVFMVVNPTNDQNNFTLFTYNPLTLQFDLPQLDASGQTYIGGGQIYVRDNFTITSKKFNAIDDGQQIQLGYIDVLMDNTANGAITLNVYMNYNNSTPVNQLDENQNPVTLQPDPFFNVTVQTYQDDFQGITGTKNWQRIFCPVRGQFITVEWTLSNAQMNGIQQQSDVQIDSQILWIRKAGRLI